VLVLGPPGFSRRSRLSRSWNNIGELTCSYESIQLFLAIAPRAHGSNLHPNAVTLFRANRKPKIFEGDAFKYPTSPGWQPIEWTVRQESVRKEILAARIT